MRISFSLTLSAAIVATANAQSFDYSGPATGSAKCALINVIMDESGSMSGDQVFMKNVALPKMATKLHSSDHNYTDVFVCSSGFGVGFLAPNPQVYRHFGCTTYDAAGVIADSSVVAWNSFGTLEDGWYAMMKGMEDVPASIAGIDVLSHCASVDKNLILVTDEDRDDLHSNMTAASLANLLDTNGYILNVIAWYIIDNTLDNFGMKIGGDGSDTTIFKYSNVTENHTTYQDLRQYDTYAWGKEGTHAHYTELIVGKPGAAWNINSLRAGGLLAETFAEVFVDIKVQEISNGTGGPSGGGVFVDTKAQEISSEGNSVRRGSSEIGGDPHITTWNNKEHYEYHGQCDLVMTKDQEFAHGRGLHVHIRTKLVRYWSYIKSVAIRIGDDILEIEGSGDVESQYWVNFEAQGNLDTFAGYTVTQSHPSRLSRKREYKIDLSPDYEEQYIIVQVYREFVRVKFSGDERAFGNTVGLLGDYTTGKTFGRDRSTVIHDFIELGNEWQVLPFDQMLFHDVAHPQFPEPCVQPEDPRGARRRRLEESSISLEEAEKACATLKDPLSIKDCVYDVLATQDVGMVGAF